MYFRASHMANIRGWLTGSLSWIGAPGSRPKIADRPVNVGEANGGLPSRIISARASSAIAG